MLTTLAYSMVVVFMFLIMTKRLPALVALIIVPIAFGIIGGFGPELGPMMLDGIKKLAPTGVMLMFAILYFGIMIDAGLFDPVVRRILKIVDGDPMKIVVGTAALAMFISLDGDGATTYMITVSAMLPLYKRMGMSRLVLACVIMLAGGVFNILPWGGPTARAASALGVDVSEIFVPMILPMAVTALWVLFVAYMLGMKERKRIGFAALPAGGAERKSAPAAGFPQPALAGMPPTAELNAIADQWVAHGGSAEAAGAHAAAAGSGASGPAVATPEITLSGAATARPKLIWINFLLTAALMVLLIMGALPLPALFMIFFAIAIMVNYPGLQEQKERIASHASNAVPVVSLIFAAGIFVGILQGTKMVDAIANSVIAGVPEWMGPYLAVVTGILSIPFTFFISNDAFYFGIVPVLAKAAEIYGISAAEIGRASIVGQPVHLLSPLVASTYLLVGMSEVEFGDHQRYTLLWSISATLVMLVAAILFGVIPLMGNA
ncbi:CitMHS family transporter [Pseudoduganella umbonata]|uniref:CitMHS family citrate-Mg2+:H+ or citrate-Ca2+:H+ symporter n=1 Tax=Pseudoduganella umbonata TaxID=864828 RepID=A0A4V1EEC7_9BURK|nr:CitMHS family transporter [Pseudoduganella umbonata]MBB3224003.1 CitMHS family citrate-Mg2+:H+ or citrate-Ca2+:H+ symporter [Pseudoduganella umbonata]QCP14121.1 citrate:proton symporter [Pseudoduganella umbonata]